MVAVRCMDGEKRLLEDDLRKRRDESVGGFYLGEERVNES